MSVAGSLTVEDGGVLSFPAVDPYTHGRIVITESCGADSVTVTDDGAFIVEEGGLVRILGMDWREDEVKEGGHTYLTFITVRHTADTSKGTFRMEAQGIPDGTHSFPFITSGAHVVIDPATAYESVSYDLAGGCSELSMYHESNGTWGNLWLITNHRDSCTGTIIGLAIGLPAAGALLILVLYAVFSGSSNPAPADYSGL